MAETKIEWTDCTWNPVVGCSIMSAGCSNCYAMRMAARLEAMGVEKYRNLTRQSGKRAVWTGKVRCDELALAVPLRWKKPRKIFVNSMSDLFHPGVPDAFVERIWDTMAKSPHHHFQILTKRPDRMAQFTAKLSIPVLSNVWLGTSVESSEVVQRLDDLRMVQAVIRFVSFEPLISSVSEANLTDIHWAIVGGESGPAARPIQHKWVDEIEFACRQTGTAFFFKQWGGKNKKAAGRSYRGKTWDELPISVQT